MNNSIPSCFLPAQSRTVPAAWADPYAEDEYSVALKKIGGICVLYDIALQNVIRVAPADGVCTNKEREEALAQEVDGYDTQLGTLRQQLNSLRVRKINPKNWGYSQDGLIGKVDNLWRLCKRLSEDRVYNNSKRATTWHFRSALESLNSLREELIVCSADFSQYSDYTQTRTGPFFPPAYETRRLLPRHSDS